MIKVLFTIAMCLAGGFCAAWGTSLVVLKYMDDEEFERVPLLTLSVGLYALAFLAVTVV